MLAFCMEKYVEQSVSNFPPKPEVEKPEVELVLGEKKMPTFC